MKISPDSAQRGYKEKQKQNSAENFKNRVSTIKMPKLRKLRKAQKFRYHVNRKRIAKSQESTRNDRIKVNK